MPNGVHLLFALVEVVCRTLVAFQQTARDAAPLPAINTREGSSQATLEALSPALDVLSRLARSGKAYLSDCISVDLPLRQGRLVIASRMKHLCSVMMRIRSSDNAHWTLVMAAAAR